MIKNLKGTRKMGVKVSFGHSLFKIFDSEQKANQWIDKNNHKHPYKIKSIEVVPCGVCQGCGKDLDEDFEDTYCMKCEDLMYDARVEQTERDYDGDGVDD